MQSNFINAIIKGSNPLLIVMGLFSFIVFGVYSVDYYAEINEPRFGYSGAMAMAVLLALIQEIGRFALLIASVRDFALDNKRNGYIGLVVSILLVIHDLTIAHKISKMWSPTDSGQYFSVLFFLILFGLAVEIRLILAYNSSSSVDDSKKESPVISTAEVSTSGVSAAGASAAGASASTDS